MDSIEDALYQIAAVIMFCMALSIFFLMNRNTKELIIHTKDNLNNDRALYIQGIEEFTPITTVDYKDIIATLLSDLYDTINVDGKRIAKEDYSYLQFDYSQIARKTYTKSYYYNEDGNINYVYYKSN